LTPEAKVATKYVAPLLIGFGVLSTVAGCWAVATATEMVVKSDDVRATEVVTAARQVRAEK
jgi:hypothetical protein